MKITNSQPNGIAGLVSNAANASGVGGIPVDTSTPPTDGQVLVYDDGTETWVPATAAGGGAPTTVNYLVGTADAGLSAEIVVGTTPGGELGNTWASPTVDATHSGSSHAGTQTAAEATAAGALATHDADTTSVHGITNTANLYAAGGTDVAVADGGTGSSTAAGAATNLGLGTGDSPQFTAVNVGDAADSTLARVSAGVLAVEGVTLAVALRHLSGRYYSIQGNYNNFNQTDALNLLLAAPIYVPETATYDRIAVACTGTVANAIVRLGIYNDGGGKPTTLVLDAGTVTAAAAAVRTITISQSLTPGWYWLACVGQTAAPNLTHMFGASGGMVSIGTTTPNSPAVAASFTQGSISGALPSPWGATLTETYHCPVVWIRRA